MKEIRGRELKNRVAKVTSAKIEANDRGKVKVKNKMAAAKRSQNCGISGKIYFD